MRTKIQIVRASFFILLLLASQALWAVPPRTFSALYPVFSKDNSQLIYLDRNHNQPEIVKIHTSTGKVLKRVPLKLSRNLAPFAATPDGFKILATTPQGIAVIHNGTGKILRTLPYPSSKENSHSLSVQSHDGVILAVASIDHQSRKIDLVHTGSGKVLHSIDMLKGEKWTRYPTIKSIGMSQNRRMIAYEIQATQKSTLHLYDIYKKVEIFRLDLPRSNATFGKIKFSNNGKMLVLHNSARKRMSLVNIDTQTVKQLSYDYSSFAGFTPDDNLIIVQLHTNRITLYNTQTGQTKNSSFKFQTNNGVYGGSITQSLDKSLLALPIISMNPNKINQIALINARTGQLLRTIEDNDLR